MRKIASQELARMLTEAKHAALQHNYRAHPD
jgi:hypothetical protein